MKSAPASITTEQFTAATASGTYVRILLDLKISDEAISEALCIVIGTSGCLKPETWVTGQEKVLKTDYVGRALAYILIIVGASVADCVALSLSCTSNTSRNSSTLFHRTS